MLKIRRPLGRLIFNMGIAIPGKTVFLIETAPRWKLNQFYCSCHFQLIWSYLLIFLGTWWWCMTSIQMSRWRSTHWYCGHTWVPFVIMVIMIMTEPRVLSFWLHPFTFRTRPQHSDVWQATYAAPVSTPCATYRWLSARLQYLQCISNEDIAVLL